jgi:hypothetical protein
MAIEKTVKFAIDELSRFQDDENKDLAVGRILFLSTRPNSHKLDITEDVLRKYAPTIIGKWVVAEYDKWSQDATTHTNEEVIQGIVPHNAQVEFVRAEDGYLDAYVDCVISKLYSTDIYDIFVKDNKRNVSVEMITDVDPEVGGVVHYLNIFAVTVLGKQVNPSVPNAHMEIVKFSEEQANDYYDLWSDIRNKENMSKMAEKISLNDEEKQGDTKMAKLEDNKAVECSEDDKNQDNIVMNECGDGEKTTELSEDEKTEDDKNDDDDMHDDDDDKEDDDKESDMATKCADLETKLSEMTAQMSENDNKIKEYEAELSELRTFKANVEEAQKMEVVTATLAQVKDYMSDEKYSEYSESGKACKFADITAWKNEVLANVTTDVLNAKMSEKETDHIDMSFPQVEEKHGLWD